MSFLKKLACYFADKCETDGRAATIAETERLITAAEAAWEPVRQHMREEARRRPDMAQALRVARENAERPITEGGR